MGNFVINKAKNGEYYFKLTTDNFQNIFTSQRYISKPACYNGIQSIKTNCSDDSRYDRRQSVRNRHYFVLNQSNGLKIGKSEMFASKAEMNNMIESVKNNGNNKSIFDYLPDNQ